MRHFIFSCSSLNLNWAFSLPLGGKKAHEELHWREKMRTAVMLTYHDKCAAHHHEA